MFNYEYDHLKIVALRNADLYHRSAKRFVDKMTRYKWTAGDIELMIKIIKESEKSE